MANQQSLELDPFKKKKNFLFSLCSKELGLNSNCSIKYMPRKINSVFMIMDIEMYIFF